MKEISSPKNEQFVFFKSLLKSRGLKDASQFILSGSKLIQETLADSNLRLQIKTLLINKEHLNQISTDRETTAPSKNPSAAPWIGTNEFILDLIQEGKSLLLASELFDELDTLGTKAPLLVMTQPSLPPWNQSLSMESGLQILCPLGDPQNVGTIIRTAYAFGADSVVLLEEAANPFLPKAVKASSGAVLRLPLFRGPSIHSIQAPAMALDLNGMSLNEIPRGGALQLLVGEEGLGIPSGFKGKRITLPMKNPMESLNAAIATSIAIYELTR